MIFIETWKICDLCLRDVKISGAPEMCQEEDANQVNPGIHSGDDRNQEIIQIKEMENTLVKEQERIMNQLSNLYRTLQWTQKNIFSTRDFFSPYQILPFQSRNVISSNSGTKSRVWLLTPSSINVGGPIARSDGAHAAI